mgnify:CR=1 FL=1
MPTQQQIAEHLDLSQKQVSELMERLAIDWQACGMDEIRVAYIRNLRDRAAGHRSEDGLDLVRERVLTGDTTVTTVSASVETTTSTDGDKPEPDGTTGGTTSGSRRGATGVPFDGRRDP